MPQLQEERRESWGTRSGFILAAVGSAVGLGNLWGFPYKLYDNGGAAFLIPYVVAMFVVGIPVMILEFSLGHFTQRAAPDAFGRAHKRLEFVGWWGIILGFVIVTFYPAILAYCFSFLWYSIKGILNGGQLPWAGQGIEGVKRAEEFFYQTYLHKHEGLLQWNIILPLILSWLTMYFCIFRGVKLVGKIVWLTVPLPWLMLAVLTVNGLMLKGSIDGLTYYLIPDWSELLKPTTWQAAFGQAFFSLSLAFGVMVTYASFLHRKSDLNNNAVIIGLADFATSFVAGLAIFATLGGMSYITRQAGNPVGVEDVIAGGPGLAFVAFPYALAQLPAAAWWSVIFFFTLLTLGIDSAFSITESVLASVVDKTGWKRSIVLPVMSLIGFGFGLIFVTRNGLNWLGVIADNIYGTWGIGFVGMLECIVLGWFWRIDFLRRHANNRSDWRINRLWDFLIRIIIPVILGTLFIWGLYSDLTGKGGFLRDESGKLDVMNCTGFVVMMAAPILAISVSIIKSSKRTDVLMHGRGGTIKGRKQGFISLVFALIAVGMIVFLLVNAAGGRQYRIVLWASLLFAVAAVGLGNITLGKYNRQLTEASWFGRWGGMVGTLGISGFTATWLIYYTTVHAELTKQQRIHELMLVVLVFIASGLIWCTYKAILKPEEPFEPQLPEEIGDEGRADSGD
ncbi:MAG: sodium-dependent transporter [Sedimentisphaerales bacterium]|nr:sodium-dependent transporter [Sedimentisphaerales bacterium]